MFGRSAEEFYQNNRSIIIDPSDDRFIAAFETRNRTGEYNGELNFVRKTGEVFPADVSSSIFNDSAGNIRATVRIRDISERKRAEEALRESREHYKDLYRLIRLMCDNVPDLIWAKDMQQRYIFANKAMCDVLLQAEDTQEPVGRTDLYFAEKERAGHPEQPDWHTFGELCMDTDTTVMTTKAPGRFDEFGNVRGSHLFLDVSKAPFWDEQGTMIGTVGCGRDVTTLKQLEEERTLMEQKLKRASDDWRLTFDTIPDVITIIDNEYRIVRANRAAWEKLGCGVHDLLGQTCYSMFHRLDAPPDFCPHARLMEDGQTHSAEIFEPRLNCCVDVTVTPLLDQDGRVNGSIHVAHDISKIKQAGETVRKSEVLYRSILTASPDTIVITDLEGRIRMVSPAGLTMFGYGSSEEVQGRTILDFIIPEDRERAAATILLLLKGTFSGPDEYRAVRSDGSTVTVEANGDFIIGTDGQTESMIFVIRNINDRKRVEEELNKKNSEIEQFIYTVSHDLRSPLVTIKTFLGYLENDMAGDNHERVAQDMQFIHGAANKMKLLLDELLEMSRIDRVEAPPVRVTLMELLGEVLDILAGAISEQRVDIHLPATDLTLFGDRARLCQIWQNLVENAIKYSREGGTVRVELGAYLEDGETVFFVKDNGIGIEPQYHGKIFGIFEKLDHASPGAGLGLSMVQRIVEKNGGRIWIESEGAKAEKGSTFFFTLPGAIT
jgi:PAS domain S-box-containing protein